MSSFSFRNTLMVVINRRGEAADSLLHLCREAILGGAEMIQYRDKEGNAEEVVSIGRKIAALCHQFEVPLILNDYVDLVDLVGADGVHLGQTDLAIAVARMKLGRECLIGATASTPEEAVRAEREGADYIGCGHIYPTSTKIKSTPPIGIDGLRRVVASVEIPVIAIGGIERSNLSAVLEARPAGVALSSAITAASSPRAECQLLIHLLQRYERQTLLPEVGWEGQRRLQRASVLIVGCGGLGCPALLYLASAGVGAIGVVDGDRVEPSNLPRQPLFTPVDLGANKAEIAAARVRELNPEIDCRPFSHYLTPENCDAIASGYQIIIDATDRPEPRYLISELCGRSGRAHVYGAIQGWTGHLSLFNVADERGSTTSYSQLFPLSPESAVRCAEVGVLPMIPGTIGTMMALEVVKLILGIRSRVQDHLLTVQLTSYEQRMYSLSKIHTDAPFQMVPSLSTVPTISISELASMLRSDSPPLLIDVRERSEPVEGHIGGLWMPMQELFHSPPSLSEGQRVVVYCRTGRRSLLAARFLLDRYPSVDIRSLEGDPLLLYESIPKE